MLSRSDWIEAQIIKTAKRNGYDYVSVAMNRMFAHLGGQPISLSELARRISVSRQAVHKLALEAERRGLVEFITSEKDGRVKLLRFAPKGLEMARLAIRDFAEIEAKLEKRIGKDRLAQLLETLAMPWESDD